MFIRYTHVCAPVHCFYGKVLYTLPMGAVHSTDHDALVLGGGPAGLSAALRIAERGMRPLVLERGAIGDTQKTWLTFDHALSEHGLSDAVRHRFGSVTFSSYLGGRYSMTEPFLSPIDERKALLLLAEKARAKGASIAAHEEFISYRYEGDAIIVVSSKREYRARIAVDATGRDSRVPRSIGCVNDAIDMGCLAYILKRSSGYEPSECLLYDSYFPGPDYFWLVPLGNGTVMAGVFFFSSLTAVNYREKEALLQRYIAAKKIRGAVAEKRAGNIPLGEQRAIGSGRMMFFGDTAHTPLPSSGFSFSRCLAESPVLAEFAEGFIDGKKKMSDFTATMLAPKVPGIELHLLISDMLANFTDTMLDRAIRGMEKLDESFVVDFLSGRDMSVAFCAKALLAITQTFTVSEITALSLKQKYLTIFLRLYRLLPSIPKAKLVTQLADFARTVIHARMDG